MPDKKILILVFFINALSLFSEDKPSLLWVKDYVKSGNIYDYKIISKKEFDDNYLMQIKKKDLELKLVIGYETSKENFDKTINLIDKNIAKFYSSIYGGVRIGKADVNFGINSALIIPTFDFIYLTVNDETVVDLLPEMIDEAMFRYNYNEKYSTCDISFNKINIDAGVGDVFYGWEKLIRTLLVWFDNNFVPSEIDAFSFENQIKKELETKDKIEELAFILTKYYKDPETDNYKLFGKLSKYDRKKVYMILSSIKFNNLVRNIIKYNSVEVDKWSNIYIPQNPSTNLWLEFGCQFNIPNMDDSDKYGFNLKFSTALSLRRIALEKIKYVPINIIFYAQGFVGADVKYMTNNLINSEMVFLNRFLTYGFSIGIGTSASFRLFTFETINNKKSVVFNSFLFDIGNELILNFYINKDYGNFLSLDCLMVLYLLPEAPARVDFFLGGNFLFVITESNESTFSTGYGGEDFVVGFRVSFALNFKKPFVSRILK